MTTDRTQEPKDGKENDSNSNDDGGREGRVFGKAVDVKIALGSTTLRPKRGGRG